MDLLLPKSSTTDQDVQRFIVEGYAIVSPKSLPEGFHEDFIELADSLEPEVVPTKDDAPTGVVWGNPDYRGRVSGQVPGEEKYYVVAEPNADGTPTSAGAMMDNTKGTQVRELQDRVDTVYDSPEVRNLMTAMLGRGYVMDASTHSLQNSAPGRLGQQWHKGQTAKRRHHGTRFCFGFYYPQEVTIELGPTEALARSQYFIATSSADFTQSPREDVANGVDYLAAGGPGGVTFQYTTSGSYTPPAAYGRQRYLTVPAGSVLLVHYDLWHRGTGNTGNSNRYLVKKYFFRVEEPATAGPSWDHQSTVWDPKLDGPVFPEMSLLPVWLQVWRWMCGAIDEEADAFIPEEYSNQLALPEVQKANDPEFLRRLGMFGAPWCIDLPKEALGGLWVAKPAEMMSPEGFPSEVAALRAAYVIGHCMNETTAHLLLRALVDGATHTHTAGHPGNVIAYNASYSLQTLCSRPRFALQSGMITALRQLLEAGPAALDGLAEPINVVGTAVSQNYSAWVLADTVAALIVSKASNTKAAQEEIQAVIVAMGEVLVFENAPLSVQTIQWACAESLGIINCALKVKADTIGGVWSDMVEISRTYLLTAIDKTEEIIAANPDLAHPQFSTKQIARATDVTTAVAAASSSAGKRLEKMVRGMTVAGAPGDAATEERALLALRATTRSGVAGSAKGQLGPRNQLIFALYKLGQQAGPPLPPKKPEILTKYTYVVGTRTDKFSFMSN